MEPQIVAIPQFDREIIWEKNIIRIPFNTQDERDNKIYGLIKGLQAEVERLKKERDVMDFLCLTKEQAKDKIIGYLKSRKLQGHGKIELFEISCNLRIPASQAEEILGELEKEGIIKEA